jgi:hypothetical protein
MRTFAFLILAAGGLAVLPAHAASYFYVGAGVSSNEVDNIQDSFTHLNNTSWKAFAGARPLSWIGGELDYLDLGSQTQSFVGGSTDQRADAFAGFAVGYLPLPLPWLDVYGKLGFSRWDLHRNVNGTPPPGLFSFSTSGTDFAWGAGGQVHYGNFGARLEYEGFDIPNTNGARIFSLSAFVSFY